MSDQTGGMGAEVGARKFDENDDVVQEEGVANVGGSRLAWAIFYLMLILSAFGIWKVAEIILMWV